MKKHILVLLCLAIAFSACEQPGPIELVDERMSEPWDVVFLKENGDSPIVSETSVDLTGLTKEDEQKFPGTVLITEVANNLGDHQSRFSYARILLEDRSAPFDVSGRFGTYTAFPRIDVGKATLDKSEFELSEWILKIRSLTLILVRTGVFYKLGNDGIQSGKPFTFKNGYEYDLEVEGRGAVKSFDMEITTPGALSVKGISPQSLILRDEDVHIRWTGKAGKTVKVVISTFDESTGRAEKPLMMFSANPRGNSVVLSKKLLQLLPESTSGKYLISLISANREVVQIEGYSENVLVQAATIQNIAVTIR